MENRSKVCVTGASSFIGSWLVQKLLRKGHVVHATLRNLEEKWKTQLLKSLPGADTRLHLFEAELYHPLTFEAAIQGCEFVFLVATPMQHNTNNSQYEDTTQASVAAVRSILQSCERSGTVKRVIYTGSVTAASPLKGDGTGFQDFIDESCWTPLHLSFAWCEDFEKSYVCSKTESEKAALSYNFKEGKKEFEVVSLACGLVGGDTLLPSISLSVRCMISPLTGEKASHRQLQFLQALLGSVPLVHIEDVCEAHAFCMEKPSMAGRFLLASAYPTMQELVDYYTKSYPQLRVIKEVEGDGHGIGCRSTRMADMGFRYRYNAQQTLHESVESAKRLGHLENYRSPCQEKKRN
ncbi:putative anthocyanidin reductase [Phoenix dactylifera]|uniref:Anthocyanidin reductase n=1 Tax=Phoenix dactylifera TaxID=42345 RepID=A0A8B7BRF3_PHODC|nr:putative anthocyanidin reductase [Phoenix dactylifera]